jgi:hypothetical protein
MKLFFSTLVIAFFYLCPLQSFAQKTYASIEKNVNLRAKHLFHDLNTTRDTLILRSDKKLMYVYAISEDQKRIVNGNINAYNFEVPLDNLHQGKHVFVVGQSPLNIVFIVRVYKDRKIVVLMED